MSHSTLILVAVAFILLILGVLAVIVFPGLSTAGGSANRTIFDALGRLGGYLP